MIDLDFEIIFKKKWQKALLYSFVYYLILLVLLCIAIMVKRESFSIGLLAIISPLYLIVLILCFRYMYIKFGGKFRDSNY